MITIKANNLTKFPLIGITTLLIVAGCESKPADTPAASTPPADVKKNLKIVYFSEKQFMTEYGNSFHKKYPNVELQVIPTSTLDSGGKRTLFDNSAIMEQKPDLVFGGNLIRDLNNMGKLLELSPFMNQDKFDLSLFSPAAIDALKATVNGKLVGLSPSFQTTALYYNKTLFDRLQIPYPTNDMSWHSMMQLAKKIAQTENGKPLYGMDYYQKPDQFLKRYTEGTGADWLSEDGRKALYTSEPYRAATASVLDAFRSGMVYLPPEKPEPAPTKKDVLLKNKFVAGEAAMAISDPGLISTLRDAAALKIPAFAWDIMTEPVNPDKPGQSSTVYIADIFAIPLDTPNKQTAWEFLKFITGQDMAAELAKTKPYVLSIRKDAVKEVDGHRLDPFYAHRPVQAADDAVVSPQIADQIFTVTREETTEMLYGRKSMADSLNAMQIKVQQFLDQAATAK